MLALTSRGSEKRRRTAAGISASTALSAGSDPVRKPWARASPAVPPFEQQGQSHREDNQPSPDSARVSTHKPSLRFHQSYLMIRIIAEFEPRKPPSGPGAMRRRRADTR